MRQLAILAVPLTLSLAACQVESDPEIDQTGPTPELPEPNDSLIPAMKTPTPEGWDGEMPTVPAGFTITPIAPSPSCWQWVSWSTWSDC